MKFTKEQLEAARGRLDGMLIEASDNLIKIHGEMRPQDVNARANVKAVATGVHEVALNAVDKGATITQIYAGIIGYMTALIAEMQEAR